MAMTKAEMEQHWTQYQAFLTEIGEPIENGDYKTAIELSVAAWEHIDGMMQYERKYNNLETVPLCALDVVLKFAPILFDFKALDKVDTFLKGQRRIEKNADSDLSDARAKARELMWEAHRLWDHIERHTHPRQDDLRRSLGGDQDRWRSLAETWERMGLLFRSPEGGSYRLSFCTRMDDPVLAKCPSCGAVGKTPKTRFLDNLACPKCHASVNFVFLAVSN